MTAVQLHAAILASGCHLRIDAGELVIAPPPPPELERYCLVLATGVWAVATGRRWYGNHRKSGRPCGPCPKEFVGPLAHGALDTTRLLPREVGLLCVEGEECSMDRIPSEWLLDIPEVYQPLPVSEPAVAPKTGSTTRTVENHAAV